MDFSPRTLLRGVLRLGSGEFLGRLASITTVILLGHRYGVVILGVYALAMTVTLYAQPLIDFGLRHIGARLVARFPAEGRQIVSRVQRRRLLMAIAVLPFILLYAALANLPLAMKVFLFVFAAIGALHAISLDWAAWGREHLQFFSLARAVVPLGVLAGVLVAIALRGRVLNWLVLGSLMGYLLQAGLFWAWWKCHLPNEEMPSENFREIDESLAWSRSSIMGAALIANLAFTSIDMLMLGVMASPEQVGLYGAAYRIINQVLVTYYLLTNTLYPQFARQQVAERARMLRFPILLPLFGAGAALATLVAVFRQPVLSLLFGRTFIAAAPLLFLLAWCLPLDFLTSYLNSAYVAWGMAKKFLACTVIAVGTEVLLDLIWIPRYGALAAAVNTLISYVVFLTALALAGRSVGSATVALEPDASV
jgi:O-antigen/teichoic acid export membrane protein